MLDIFATLLGTSLNACAPARPRRCRAPAAWQRRSPSAATSCVGVADRLAAALEAQFDRGRADRARRGGGARAGRAAASWSSRSSRPARHCATASADAEARQTRTLGPADPPRPTTSARLADVARRRAALPRHAATARSTIELSLVDVGPRLRDDLWGDGHRGADERHDPRHPAPRASGLDARGVEHVASPFDYPSPRAALRARGLPRRATPTAPRPRSSTSWSSLIERRRRAHPRALHQPRGDEPRRRARSPPRLDTPGARPGHAVAPADHRSSFRDERRGEPLRGHQLLAGHRRAGPLAQPGHHRPPALRRAQRPAGRGAPRHAPTGPSTRSTCRARPCCWPRGSGRLIRTRDGPRRRGGARHPPRRGQLPRRRCSASCPHAPHPRPGPGARLPPRASREPATWIAGNPSPRSPRSI